VRAAQVCVCRGRRAVREREGTRRRLQTGLLCFALQICEALDGCGVCWVWLRGSFGCFGCAYVVCWSHRPVCAGLCGRAGLGWAWGGAVPGLRPRQRCGLRCSLAGLRGALCCLRSTFWCCGGGAGRGRARGVGNGAGVGLGMCPGTGIRSRGDGDGGGCVALPMRGGTKQKHRSRAIGCALLFCAPGDTSAPRCRAAVGPCESGRTRQRSAAFPVPSRHHFSPPARPHPSPPKPRGIGGVVVCCGAFREAVQAYA